MCHGDTMRSCLLDTDYRRLFSYCLFITEALLLGIKHLSHISKVFLFFLSQFSSVQLNFLANRNFKPTKKILLSFKPVSVYLFPLRDTFPKIILVTFSKFCFCFFFRFVNGKGSKLNYSRLKYTKLFSFKLIFFTNCTILN